MDSLDDDAVQRERADFGGGQSMEDEVGGLEELGAKRPLVLDTPRHFECDIADPPFHPSTLTILRPFRSG